MITLYLAGPDVFAPDPQALGAAKKQICLRHGLVGLYPMDVVPFDPAQSREAFSLAVFDGLERVMRTCDGALVNLTPFQGLSLDVGTAFEMGFLRALGKPLFGYSNVGAGLRERAAAAWGSSTALSADASLRDPVHGMEADSLGNADNLMIDNAIARSTGVLVRQDVPVDEMFTSLGPFTACVEAAAAWFASRV